MGITGEIKKISSSTLDLFIKDPYLVDAFFDAKYLPESPYWQREPYWTGEYAEVAKQNARAIFGNTPAGRSKQWKNTYDWQALEELFLSEWENPELDLDKSWEEITFLLAGYIATYYNTPQGKIPELIVEKGYEKDFLPFLVIKNSQWDGKPLVNAFGAGKDLYFDRDYGPVRYLQAGDEVGQILDGLLELSQEGFKNRFIKESQKPNPVPWIDWSDEEMIDYMTDYYNEIVDYYETAVKEQKALLLYLT
ncbi:DUF1877 family protein [Aulosira sp. FACHB-615]|uniref:DUF1877 family protein n=1 Tax=Aulosira sp. FACHB-615 TaxID=2692777 RepID=UPI0016882FAA|nr:DUF1877 family protein [Aulosira sp. FACHB-615]MBD2492247.1 DUF1877 family protein [Aulosira sp. FACHB-615]